MLKHSLVLVLGILALGINAPAYANLETGLQEVTTAEPTASDKQLTAAVRSQLQTETALHSSMEDIQLKTVKGIVYVKGSVASETERSAIESKIRSYPDVTAVQNYISVRSARS